MKKHNVVFDIEKINAVKYPVARVDGNIVAAIVGGVVYFLSEFMAYDKKAQDKISGRVIAKYKHTYGVSGLVSFEDCELGELVNKLECTE